MPPLSPAALRQQMASGELGPLYLLIGEDEAEKTVVASDFLQTIEEGLEAFNADRLYGGEMQVSDLEHAAATLPLMSARRIVLVLQGERLLMPKRNSKAADEQLARLEAWIQAPPSHATVVFVCGSLDQRRRVVKLLHREAHVVDCGTVEDEQDAARWVRARGKHAGLQLEADAVTEIVARTGPDVVRLRAAVDRLSLFAAGESSVSAQHVRDSVPAGPESQADFGIAKAIWRNDVAAALKELHLAYEAGAAPVMLLGQVRTAAEKLPAARVAEAIEAVLETDLALKRSAGDPKVLLERLVLEMCEAPRRGATVARASSRRR